MSKFTLKEIAEIQSGPFGTQLHKNEYVDSGILMINAKNVGVGIILTDSADYVSKQVCKRLPAYILKEDDILFGRAGSIDKHAYIEKEFSGSFQGTNCIRIRCRDIKISKYISYYLWKSDIKQRIVNNTGGSVLSYISSDLLKDIVINFPEDKIIKSSVKTLSLIDKKIQLNNKINETLQEQASLLYDYWFTQFDFPDENGKPYKSSGGKMVYNEELKREIPEGWSANSMTRNQLFVVIKPGVDIFKTKTYLATGDVNSTSISAGRLVEFSTREGRANMQPKINSVWFAKMKNSVKHLFLNREMQPVIASTIFSTGFCGLQCTEQSFEYVSSFISCSYFETLKDILAHGATQEAVNNNDLNSIYIIIPNDNVLSFYHKIACPMYAQISKNICETQELTALRDWLLPMLMNGQATVAEEQKPISKVIENDTKNEQSGRFALWLQNQGLAARGDIDRQTLREIFDAMDDDDK